MSFGMVELDLTQCRHRDGFGDETVLLYSSGLDAYCLYELIEPAKCLFIDPGTEEAEAEKILAQRMLADDEYYHIDFPLIAQNEQEDHDVAFRNTLFVLLAGFYGRDVVVGATHGDVWLPSLPGDSTRGWARDVEQLMNEYHPRERGWRVRIPADNYTKAELVEAVLEQTDTEPEDIVQNSRSCHDVPTDDLVSQCGDCYGCARRFMAIVLGMYRVGYDVEYAVDVALTGMVDVPWLFENDDFRENMYYRHREYADLLLFDEIMSEVYDSLAM